MTKPQRFTAVFFALLLLLLYQIALMFRPFLFPVLWAALLAHLTYPLHVRFTSFVRGREVVSASCLTLLVLALVVIPISMMGVLLACEASTAGTGHSRVDRERGTPEGCRRKYAHGRSLEDCFGSLVIAQY